MHHRSGVEPVVGAEQEIRSERVLWQEDGMAGNVQRLLDAGHTVHGWNRTPEKAQSLVDQGMILAGSPRDVAERAEVVFAMVTDTKALAAVTRGPDGILAGLTAGKIFVDMTPGSPANSRALAADVEALGARMLDAPIQPGNSDSQDLNRVIESLVGRDGLSLPEAMEMVVPPIVEPLPKAESIAKYPMLLRIRTSRNCPFAVAPPGGM